MKHFLQLSGSVALVLLFLYCVPAPSAQTQQAHPAARGQGRGGGRGAGRGAPRTKKVVLAWADTRNGIAQHDSTSHALAMVERLGYESGLWDTYIRTDSNIVS